VTGTFHLARYLALDSQKSLAGECLALGGASAGFYTPVVRGMHAMSVKMLCLGRHWNAVTYRYEATRTDVDGLPVPPLPVNLIDLARDIASAAGFTMSPDICIVNWYTAASKMGLHQDKDESPESVARGVPVVSVSLGDTAIFRVGGLKRRIRSRRSTSSQAMRLCSAALLDSGTMASRESSRPRARPTWASKDVSV